MPLFDEISDAEGGLEIAGEETDVGVIGHGNLDNYDGIIGICGQVDGFFQMVVILVGPAEKEGFHT